jgi:hypothetical protein
MWISFIYNNNDRGNENGGPFVFSSDGDWNQHMSLVEIFGFHEYIQNIEKNFFFVNWSPKQRI